MAAPFHSQDKNLMGFLFTPVRTLLVIQGFTIGFLAWSSVEQHLPRVELQLALRELEAIREEDFQLTRAGAPEPGPPSGGKADSPPIKPAVGHQYLGWSGCIGTLGLGWLFATLLAFLLLLLLAGICWTRVGAGAVEPVTPVSPEGKQQLARRQLAELRLRQHGFGGQTGSH